MQLGCYWGWQSSEKILVEEAHLHHPVNLVAEMSTLLNSVPFVIMIFTQTPLVSLDGFSPHGVWSEETIQALH